MKKIIVLVVLAVLGVAAWFIWETRKRPENELANKPAVSKYSEDFNKRVNDALTVYDSLSEAFVAWDTAAIVKTAEILKGRVDNLTLNEMPKGSSNYISAKPLFPTLKLDLNTMISEPDITAKRRAFDNFSKNLYSLLQAIEYDNAVIYLQQCDMAFNGNETGIWLSKTQEIRNPYLGMHDPKYGKGMLKCGETKEKLNFTGTQEDK